MLATLLFIAFIAQGSLGTIYGDKCLWTGALGASTCPKLKWWKSHGGCGSIGSGLAAAKLGGIIAGGYPKWKWWKPYGYGRLGSGLTAGKLGGFVGGTCPALGTSFASAKCLPFIKTKTSHFPFYRSYYKPIVKTHLTKVPILKHKVKTLMSKLPCLKKKFLFPSLATLPCAKFKCLKGACFKPSLWKTSCSPYSTFY